MFVPHSFAALYQIQGNVIPAGRVMAEQTRRVAAELVGLLYRHAPAVLAANIANATLVVTALWPLADRDALYGWFAAILTISLVRLGVWWRARSRLSDTTYRRWGRWYAAGAALSGLLWGCSAWLFIDTGHPETLLLTSFVIGGMGAGAVTSLSPHLPAFYLYLIGSILLFKLRLFVLGDRISLVMAGMVTVYVIGLIVIGHNLHRMLIRSLELNEENLDLLANREQEVRLRTADLEHEIAERKRFEAGLKEAREAADRANQAKSRFLAAASHDLRQPLQSMYLFATVLRHHLGGEPKGGEVLGRIERGLDMLKGMLDSLLDLSQLDVNITKPNFTAFALKPMLDDILAAYTRVAASKGISLVGGGTCDVWVRSDQVLLGRMIRNLVENALRYTEQGWIWLCCSVEPGSAQIEVSDTGIGIPEDQLDRIFEEFHQVGNPERDKARGLGLGLAIVQRLSRVLSHPVEVRSQLGVGTTFSIRVPRVAEVVAQPDLQPAEQPFRFGAGRRVLVIDDDPMVLLALGGTFEQWGFDVGMAGGLDEAVKQLRSDAFPHLIVSDYRLRGGQIGTDVIVTLRRTMGREVPAMVLTGETGNRCSDDAGAIGAMVLYKPTTPRDLALALTRLGIAEKGKEA